MARETDDKLRKLIVVGDRVLIKPKKISNKTIPIPPMIWINGMLNA